jgi:anaerobic magnesium-protoporphyrin IX monomethyl ester cyclase
MRRRVLLVGYEQQDNLGVRYLSSRLLADGHHTRIATFSENPAPLLKTIRDERPDVVGFSLIFQYMVPEFAAVIRALRADGVTAHFTIGGHYASFEPEDLLRYIPELDSVVRFEGEDTLAELVEAVDEPARWRAVPGIAWHDHDTTTVNPPRQGRREIDDYPEPDRRDIDYRNQPLPAASLLASRGCPWKCSFCSIITFYEGNGTKGRRRRSPTLVVDEFEHVVRDMGARLVLFQDDDFLAGGKPARAWAHDIAAELTRRGLHDEARWKISCRSDEVHTEILEPLVAAGLCHVYLGVESGDETDLRSLNKLLAPQVHMHAGQVLRELDLSFDFGFMLLEPWSTMHTARNNMHFLRRFTEDGWVVAGYCRTLPYVGTPLEQRLRAEGRLNGSSLDAEYSFLDPKVDLLWDFSLMAFAERNFGDRATWNLLRGLIFDTHLHMHGHPRDELRDASARALARASNRSLLDILEAAIDLIDTHEVEHREDPALLELARTARAQDNKIRDQMFTMLRQQRHTSEALFR